MEESLLARIDDKLDRVKEQLAELTAQVRALSEHVARQNGRLGKVEGVCGAHAEELATVREKLSAGALMGQRVWQIATGLLMAAVGVLIGILTHTIKLP